MDSKRAWIERLLKHRENIMWSWMFIFEIVFTQIPIILYGERPWKTLQMLDRIRLGYWGILNQVRCLVLMKSLHMYSKSERKHSTGYLICSEAEGERDHCLGSERDQISCLFLKKGERENSMNYKPMSLTSTIYKVVREISNGIQMNSLQKRNSLGEKQHGMRGIRSCINRSWVLWQTDHQTRKKKWWLDLSL